MSPKTRQFFNEHNIYVSWVILVFVAGLTFSMGKVAAKIDDTSTRINQIYPIVNEIKELNDRVTKLESENVIAGILQDKYDIKINK